jgi:hypothetical protein
MPNVGEYVTIEKEALQGIFDFLREAGYTIRFAESALPKFRAPPLG